MRRILHAIAVVTLCLTALALTARAQTTLQIHPDRGVGVLSEDPASGERWSTSIFPFGNYVGPVSGRDVFCRTYLHFPLDEIPAGSTVQSATLRVYVDDYWPAPGSAPITTYPVAVDWTVEGVDWYDMGAWPALEEGVTTTTVTSDGGWFAWDVTTLVQGWLEGAPNYGLALAAADLGSTASNWAAARRLTAGDPATGPYLEVMFTPPTPTPSPTATPPPPPTATPPPPPAPATPPPGPILLPETGQVGGALILWPVLLGLALLTASLGLGRRAR